MPVHAHPVSRSGVLADLLVCRTVENVAEAVVGRCPSRLVAKNYFDFVFPLRTQ